MQLSSFVVFLLLLIANTFQVQSYLIKTPSRDKFTDREVDDLVKIITSCYGDRINGVGLAGDLPDTLIRKLSVEQSTPVVLIDSTVLTDIPPPVFLQFRQKLQFFVIGGTSAKQIAVIIQRNIRYSIWGNHMASYIILDPTEKCLLSRRFLYVAWTSDALNAKVICKRRTFGKMIVSYNPFTSQTPVHWEKIYSPKLKCCPGFTWFARPYLGNNSTCVNLDFDKTKDVSGHEIRVRGHNPNLINLTTTGAWSTHFWLKHTRVLDTVFNILNVTTKFSGKYNLRDALTEDIFQIPHWLHTSWKDYRLMSYPHERTGLVLISQFRGHKSQLSKILSVIDVNSRIGLGIVYLITFVFLKFFVHQALMPAILNLVRITCNTGFTNLPDNTASRLFLTGLLFFVVTMQGIYQGNLASLLTTTIPLRNINTFKDVIDLGYKNVYGFNSLKMVISNPVIKERYVEIKTDEDCITSVVHDSSGVCINFAQGFLDLAKQAKMHVSNEFVEGVYTGFEVRWNWPLERRVYDIIAKMVEADILEPWHMKCNPTILTEFQFDDEVKKNKVFKKMELVELRFAFVILGIGLACATIVLIIEVAIHRYKSRIVSVRIDFLN